MMCKTTLKSWVSVVFLMVLAGLAQADPNLVGLWEFEGDANDSSGYDNHGSVVGDAHIISDPCRGSVLSIDGIDDYVDCGDGPSLDITEAITISAWVKKNSTGSFRGIIGKWDGGKREHALMFDDIDRLRFQLSKDGTWNEGVSSSFIVSTNSYTSTTEWHHAVVVYEYVTDGTSVMNLYVNGLQAAPQVTDARGPIYNSDASLGIGNYDITQSGEYFNGEIDDVRIYNRALSAGEILDIYEQGIGYKAFNPIPSDEAVEVDPNTILSWSAGEDALLHNVYLGTAFSDVNDANESSDEYKGTQVLDANSYDPCGLGPDTTYFWRVDEVNDPCMWKGDVWSFTTIGIPTKATNPNPGDEAENVPIGKEFSWTAGTDAASHDVYFGTDFDDVNDGIGGTFKGNQTETTYQPALLDFNRIYYWRIDEKNILGVTKGDVWSFTTKEEENNLVGLWEFEGDANDSSGYDNHGTFVDDPCWVAGKIGSYALDFDGVDDYVEIPEAPSLRDISSEITLAAWIKHESLTTPTPSKDVQRYVTVEPEKAVIRNDPTWGTGFHFYIKAGGTSYQLRPDLAPQVDTWYHVVGTYKSGEMKLYINGAIVDSRTDATGTLDIASGAKAWFSEPSAVEPFNGSMDDVRIYDRALSTEEIETIYAIGITKPEIGLSATEFEFEAMEGSSNPADQVLGISNNGVNTLNWQVTEDCNWLAVEPNIGSSTGEIDDVNLSVDITGLTGGIYNCNLTISDPCAWNNPQMVSVTLHISDIDGKLYVPSEYETIQAAIDSAVNGDTVVVAEGTYTGIGNKDLDYDGKAITVRSTDPNDPCVVAATIIDCENFGRGFYFHSGEDANSIVAGLTVKNGRIDGPEPDAFGGGIYCVGASPKIINSNILNNSVHATSSASNDAHVFGGGIACVSNSHPEIINSNILNNSVHATSTHFTNAHVFGGGIACVSNSHPVIINCKIDGNLAKAPDAIDAGANAHGGGVFCSSDSTVEIYDSIITANISHGGKWHSPASYADHALNSYGGGFYISNIGGSSIENCLIANNETVVVTGIDWGGGINYGISRGAGIYCVASVTVDNCTLYGNYTDPAGIRGDGGGIYGPATVSNSIVWDNLSNSQIYGTTAITYSCTQEIIPGTGNINTDPCFASGPLGDYYLSQIAAGEASDSPCVNMGSDTAANLGMDLYTTRTDSFIDTGIVDMGYHYPIVIGTPDIKRNWHIDFGDFAVLGNDWYKSGELPGDFTRDYNVDRNDMLVLANCWLDCLVGSASGLNPSDNSKNIDPNTKLFWSAGEGALYHDIYLGSDETEVAEADLDSSEYMFTDSDTTFDPCGLDPNTNYYWRIDEIGPACVAKGDVWNFWTHNFVGWWQFELDANDSSGYDNHGTIFGNPVWVSGQMGSYALDFDGVDDYLNCGNDNSLAIDDAFTISAWVRSADLSTHSTWGDPIACKEHSSRGGYYLAWIDTGRFSFSVSDAGTESKIESNAGKNIGQWYHVAGVYDGTKIYLYVDGVLENSAFDVYVKNTLDSFYIGSWRPPIGGRYFDGTIDDVRVYDKALSAVAISQLYQEGL